MQTLTVRLSQHEKVVGFYLSSILRNFSKAIGHSYLQAFIADIIISTVILSTMLTGVPNSDLSASHCFAIL